MRLLRFFCACSFLVSVMASLAADRPNILYCLADDWAYPNAGVYGDKVIRTPNFDRVAQEGALFTHAFSASPSCSPSRAAMLTGRAPHQLREGGNLWGTLPREFQTYPNILERAGYVVGFTRKGWGPGDFEVGGRTRNPAGQQFGSFDRFLKTVPKDKPFCFWFGSHDPHRPYKKGSGLEAGLKPDGVKVPPIWPDTAETRSDILDYYASAERFDRDLGECLKLLEERGDAKNTIVVVSGDNGSPFPRAKANLYDVGTMQPLAVRWPEKVKPGIVIDALVNLYDIAPTFLDVAGLKRPSNMVGESWVPLLQGKKQAGRDVVFVERERHANCRKGDLSYPARAIRTDSFLYIRNLRPERWPAGDPEKWVAVGPFGDCDDGPTKHEIMDHRDDPNIARYFELCFAKRPAEELYDLKKDPWQMTNVVERAEYVSARKEMRKRLDEWMKKTDDPRFDADHDDDRFDKYAYYGVEKKKAQNRKGAKTEKK